MQKFFTFLKLILLILGITIVHIGIKQIALAPFIYVHVVFISVIWLILFQSSPRILWVALGPTLALELFSATPFGVVSCALMITFAFMVWLLLRVFTDYSLPMVGLAGLLGMVLYRIIFFILMEIVARHTGFHLTTPLVIQWLLESVVTAVGLMMLYAITVRFIKRLKPQYIKITT